MNLSPFLLSAAQIELPPIGESDLPGESWIVGLVYLALVVVGLLVDIGLIAYCLVHPPRTREHVERLKARPWSWYEAGILVLLLSTMFLCLFAVQGLLCRVPGFPGPDSSAWLVVQSVTFHWTGLLFVAHLVSRRKLSWRDAMGGDRRSFGKDLLLGALFYLGAIPVLWFYSLFYQMGLKYFGYNPTWQEVALVLTDEQNPWLRFYLMFMAIGLAPLFEEFLFRGIGLPLLARRWGVARAVIIVSVFFAAIHFHVPSLVPLFVIAAAFSLAYIYTESIVVPVVMHSLFNAVNLGLLMALRRYGG